MSTQICNKCNRKYIYGCRFDHRHTHEHDSNKYCSECDKCQIDTPGYDHCFDCNSVCARDLNNHMCDTCNDHDNKRLVDCELCRAKHSNAFRCSKCNTCDKTKNSKHCDVHNICHSIDSKKFIACRKCSTCVETIDNEGFYCIHCYLKCSKCHILTDNGIDGYCKRCYPSVNDKYCAFCDKIHNKALDKYEHCFICKKAFKWYNIFARMYHSDCYQRKYNPHYGCYRANQSNMLLGSLLIMNLGHS
mgnify:FL=1